MKKSFKYLSYFFVILAIIIPSFLVFSLFDANYKNQILEISRENPWGIPLLIISFKILGIVFPPVNGGFIVYSSVPYYNWFLVFIFDVFGGTIGSSIAFFLARKYREKILLNFLAIKKIIDFEKKIIKENSFIRFLFLRFMTAPIFDFISYLGGLTEISFKNYLLATLIASSIGQLFTIYLISFGLNTNILFVSIAFLPILVSFVIYKKYF